MEISIYFFFLQTYDFELRIFLFFLENFSGQFLNFWFYLVEIYLSFVHLQHGPNTLSLLWSTLKKKKAAEQKKPLHSISLITLDNQFVTQSCAKTHPARQKEKAVLWTEGV